MMTIHLQIQTKLKSIPEKSQINEWVTTALQDINKNKSITLRIVDEDESAHLNQLYRGKTGPTNVLAFPFEKMSTDSPDILGDVVICAPIIKAEADNQHKDLTTHWAHIVIHGILHLQGYDHTSEEDAIIMETQEIKLMNTLGFENPYEGKQHVN